MRSFDHEMKNLIAALASHVDFTLLRHDPLGFQNKSEVDVLVDDFRCGRFLRLLRAEACSQWKVILTRFSPTSADLLVISRSYPDHYIRLDVRGPVVKQNRVFIRLRDILDDVAKNVHGVPVLKTKREIELIYKRNSIDSRPASAKHFRILDQSRVAIPPVAHFKTSSGYSIRDVVIRMMKLPARAYSLFVMARYRSFADSIVLHGVDGAGKSVVAMELGRLLEGQGFRVEVVHYFQSAANRPQMPEKAAQTRRKFLRALPPWMKLVAFLVRGLIRNLRRSNQFDFIIHDRFLYDYFDKTEKRGLMWPNWLKRLVATIEKKTSSPVALIVDPEVANRRKNEMTPPLIRAKQQEYARMLGPELLVLVNSETPQELAALILREKVRRSVSIPSVSY